MNSLLVLMALFLMVEARPQATPELPNDQEDFTDPTKSRSKDEAPEPPHHVVKKSGTMGTRIGFIGGSDPNIYWNF